MENNPARCRKGRNSDELLEQFWHEHGLANRFLMYYMSIVYNNLILKYSYSDRYHAGGQHLPLTKDVFKFVFASESRSRELNMSIKAEDRTKMTNTFDSSPML